MATGKLTPRAPTIRLPDAPKDYDQETFQKLISNLRQTLEHNNRSSRNGYNLPNVAPTYSFDPDTATPADTAQFLAWIAYELYTRGFLA